MRSRFYNIVIIIFLLATKASATHIVGGEIYYTNLGNNNYKITLKLYRDCFGGQAPFDSPAYVGIYLSDGTLFNTISMTFPGPTPIPPTVISPCLTPPTNVCVEQAIYELTVNLPPVAGGYDIVYQRCCRNGTITNLDTPGDIGASYLAHIPEPTVVTTNSSPRFTDFPPLFMCANVPFNFNHSATDPDGDVLVYELCTPFSGASTIDPAPNPPSAPPFPFVNYLPGYTGTYPIDASPAFAINSSSGLLTGTPLAIGQYVVGVCVSEFRNGVLLSVNKRDFQFNIVSCNAAIASIPAQTMFCNGYTVDFSGAASINSNTYFWNFGDPTTLADTSNLIAPIYTYPDSGTYNVMLVAYDPTGNCYDTAYSTFYVYPLLEPSFTPPPDQCFENNSFDFLAGGLFTPSATFSWNFGNNATPSTSTQQNPTGIVYNSPGNNTVSLSISQFGCTQSFSVNGGTNTVTVPQAAIGAANQYCVGYDITIQNNSTNATSYQWDFGVNNINSDVSTAFQPQYVYPDSGIYTIQLIATNAGVCSDTATIDFWVYPLLNPLINGIEDQCIVGNSFNFEAAGAFTNDATFLWDFGTAANPSNSILQQEDSVVYTAIGQHVITLTASQYGCVKTVTDSIGLFNSPIADFSISGGTGCSPVFTQFINNSTSDTPLLYFWNLGDNNSINTINPSYSYENPGTYTVTLTVITTQGCKDTSVMVLPNVINVKPYPIAGIIATPYEASIFDPIITFSDSSKLANHCAIRISDGTFVDTCIYTHTFKDTGYYKATQIVKNELNCVDSMSITVYIFPEYRMFIPDAFSPNGDGLNDIFKPSIIGVKEFSFDIYDRWGEKIFATNSNNDGWNGTYKGENSPQSVYLYLIKVIDVKGNPHTYNGKVVLLR